MIKINTLEEVKLVQQVDSVSSSQGSKYLS